jgi:hypothetical protein
MSLIVLRNYLLGLHTQYKNKTQMGIFTLENKKNIQKIYKKMQD